MEIRIICESGHERIRCEPLYVSKAWWCPTCGDVVGNEIKDQIPEEYRPANDLRARVLQELVNYDIEIIIRDQTCRVEYPRRGNV